MKAISAVVTGVRRLLRLVVPPSWPYFFLRRLEDQTWQNFMRPTATPEKPTDQHPQPSEILAEIFHLEQAVLKRGSNNKPPLGMAFFCQKNRLQTIPSPPSPQLEGSSLPNGTLPEINMEAHGGPYIEDSSLVRAPLFHVNLEECRSLGAHPVAFLGGLQAIVASAVQAGAAAKLCVTAKRDRRLRISGEAFKG